MSEAIPHTPPAGDDEIPITPPRRPVTPIVIPTEDDENQSRRPHQAPLEDGQDWSQPLTDTPLARAKKKPGFQPLVTEEEREILRQSLKEESKSKPKSSQQQQQNRAPPPSFASPKAAGNLRPGREIPMRMKTRPSRASSMGAGSPPPVRNFRPVGLAKIQIPDEEHPDTAGQAGERSEHQAPLISGQDWHLPLTDTPLARAKKKPDFQPLVTEEEREILRQSIVPEEKLNGNSENEAEDGEQEDMDDVAVDRLEFPDTTRDTEEGETDEILTTPVPNPVPEEFLNG